MKFPAGFQCADEEGPDRIFGWSWEGDVGGASRGSAKLAKQEEGSRTTTYPGFCSVIQKSAGSPGVWPKPMYSSERPMNWYPKGCRQARKKEVEEGRLVTVRVKWENGILIVKIR